MDRFLEICAKAGGPCTPAVTMPYASKFPLRLFIVKFLLPLCIACFASVAQASTDEIRALITEANSDRSYADSLTSQARQWRMLAKTAQSNAIEAANATERGRWTREAMSHQEKAEDLESNAKSLRRQADNKQAEAEQLNAQWHAENQQRQREEARNQLGERLYRAQQIANAPSDAIDWGVNIQEITGVWIFGEVDDPFVIVQKDHSSPASMNLLTAHTAKRQWDGVFSPYPKGDIRNIQDAQVVFTYRPKAEEMNPGIPLWARQMVEGELEWRIEVNKPDSCSETPVLDAVWYPGKVEWTEGSAGTEKGAWVAGKGKQRRDPLTKLIAESPEPWESSVLRLRTYGTLEETDRKVEGLTDGQLFYIDVLMPHEEAKELGEEIQVTISGNSSGENDTVTLRSGGFRAGFPVKYTNYEPIFLGDSPRFASQKDYDSIGTLGERHDLELENAEIVTFQFGEASETTRFYTDPIARKLARYAEGAERLRRTLELQLTLPTLPDLWRDSSGYRLGMVKNLQAMMRNDKLPDFIRLSIAQHYMGDVPECLTEGSIIVNGYQCSANRSLLSSNTFRGASNITDTDFDTGPLNDKDRNGDNHLSGFYKGVRWVDSYERNTTWKKIDDVWDEKIREALLGLSKDIAYGLYDWTIDSIQLGMPRLNISFGNFGELFSVVSGQDPHGRPVEAAQRKMLVVGIISSSTLDWSQGAIVNHHMDSRDSDLAASMRGRSPHRHPPLNPGYEGSIRNYSSTRKTVTIPESVAKTALLQAEPGLSRTMAPATRGSPPSCASVPPRATLPPNPPSFDLPDRDFTHLTNSRNDESWARQAFGDSTRIIDPLDAPPRYVPQGDSGMCMAQAPMIHINDEIGGASSHPMSTLKRGVDAGVIDLRGHTGGTETHPYIQGMHIEDSRRITETYGWETDQIDGNPHWLTPAELDYLIREENWRITMIVNAGGSVDGSHAIALKGFQRDQNNCITKAVYGDPATGRNYTTDWDQLDKIRSDYPMMLARPSQSKGRVSRRRSYGTEDSQGHAHPTSSAGNDPGNSSSTGGKGPRTIEDPVTFTMGDPESATDTNTTPSTQTTTDNPREATTGKRLSTTDEKPKPSTEELVAQWMSGQAKRTTGWEQVEAQRLAELEARQATAGEYDLTLVDRQPIAQNHPEGIPPRRQLVQGDANYIHNIMADSGYQPSQHHLHYELINANVHSILRGNFPEGRDGLNIRISAQNLVTEGHHRLVAAHIVHLLTGRPLLTGPNRIIPADRITLDAPTNKMTRGNWANMNISELPGQ